MSLLLQALQKAARNRESTGPDSAAPSPTQLELEPRDSSSVPEATAARLTFAESDFSPRAKRTATSSAATVFAAAEPAGPTLVDYVRERPVAAFGMLALLFAIVYGIYLYLQIFHPQWLRGEFRSAQAIVATTPPPAATPLPTAAPKLDAVQPSPSPAISPSSTPSGLAGTATSSGQSLNAAAGAAGGTQTNSELASLMNLPPARPTERKAAEPKSRLTDLGNALNGPASVTAEDKRGRLKKSVELPPPAPKTVPSSPKLAAAPSPRPPVPRSLPPRLQASPQQSAVSLDDRVIVNAAPSVPPPASATVSDAYRALKSGKLDQAKSIYQEVLENDPKNVDAMLGIASIAQQHGNSQEALSYYGRVLEAEPRNSAAQGGIIAITGQSDINASEARLKQLIAREPSGFLHFTLGNLYARQNLWTQAQQSYFQAYQMEADNSDYAYNLAVGLEHISQPKLAITYYRKALDLSIKQGRATFNQEQVIDRIGQLSLRSN